jgi:hypothetical protein
MPAFYVTFGINTPRAEKYQRIEAPDYAAARRLVIQAYGSAWAMIYDEKGFRPLPKRYNITALDRILR